MSRRRPAATAFAALAWLAAPDASRAQGCSFAATDLDFGTVDTLAAGDTDTAGSISINCTGALFFVSGTINIAAGTGGATPSARRLTSPGRSAPLDYQLYSDASRSITVGSDYWSNGGTPISFSSSELSIIDSTTQLPVYGRAFGAQGGVAPGAYLSQFGPADVVVDYQICNALLVCSDFTETFAFDVRATVDPECTVQAADLDFGSVGVIRGNIDATSQITVTCTAATDFQIALGNGLAGTGPADRLMTNPNGHDIRYGLYQDAARAVTWGNTLDSDAQPGTGSGSAAIFPVYGRVPQQTTPPPGVYTDTIVVTVTY